MEGKTIVIIGKSIASLAFFDSSKQGEFSKKRNSQAGQT
nr:MAG TPA: Esterase GDSL/SGNH-like Acyl-Esterase family found in Pmr5 and Cas1p [Caudoviricetes sp.]